MKQFATALILLLLAISSPEAVEAQGAWANVSPKGEQFSVLMPESPTTTTQKYNSGQFNVEGRVYSVISNSVEYRVWSLKNPSYADYKSIEGESYLDGCADLVWAALLKPWRDEVLKSSELPSRMSWAPNVTTINLAGPAYLLVIGKKPGLVHIIALKEQLYVLAVLNADDQSDDVQLFMYSFSAGREMPKMPKGISLGRGGGIGPGEGAGIGPGRGGNTGGGDFSVGTTKGSGGSAANNSNTVTDYNRVFSGREVTEKARVLSKATPQYTESARRYSVTGTVVLRAVFANSGEVTNIRAISGLPHGLTQKAIAAARQIQFIPATKDGHKVSQYVQLEFNFDL